MDQVQDYLRELMQRPTAWQRILWMASESLFFQCMRAFETGFAGEGDGRQHAACQAWEGCRPCYHWALKVTSLADAC